MKIKQEDLIRTIVKKPENDARRNMKKCIYHEKDGNCNFYGRKCYTSSNCDEYREYVSDDDREYYKKLAAKLSRSKKDKKKRINYDRDAKFLYNKKPNKKKKNYAIIYLELSKEEIKELFISNKIVCIDLLITNLALFPGFKYYDYNKICIKHKEKDVYFLLNFNDKDIIISGDYLTIHTKSNPIFSKLKNVDIKFLGNAEDTVYGKVSFVIFRHSKKCSNNI